MPKTTSQRQKEYYKRMKEAGMKRVFVWVPEGKEKPVQSLAKELRG